MNRLSCFTAIVLSHFAFALPISEIKSASQSETKGLLGLYQHLHQYPELSLSEEKTSQRLAKELALLGFKVQENIGGFGIVGVLKNGEGPTLLVRTDMDALPVTEKTGLKYASKTKQKNKEGKLVSVMHACGHDMHMTVWVGTARILSKLRAHWKGTLVFIAQPAEELGLGANMMLKAGLYKKFPKPDFAIALHVTPDMEAGTIGFRKGYAMANADFVSIRIPGIGGHGAYPHATKDPIVLASKIILGLQTIVSREVSPLDPSVITVGSIHGGTKSNIIPDEVVLEMTVRSFTDENRWKLLNGIKRTAVETAKAAGFPKTHLPKVKINKGYTPSLYNNPKLMTQVLDAMTEIVGKNKIIEKEPVLGAEDFAQYGRTSDEIPISMVWLGSIDSNQFRKASQKKAKLPSLHSALYAPDPKPTINTGVTTMSAAAIKLLGKKGKAIH